MKTIHLIAMLSALGLLDVKAQNATTSQTSLPTPTPYQLSDHGSYYKVWQSTTYEAGPNGQFIPHSHHYTELASGMYYQDANGNWLESQEQIVPYVTGAIAQQGQYQVIFASDLNSAGAIDQQTPDGKRLQSSILGLAYYDSSSGQTVMIGTVQDSQGELISSNQALYPNAFSNLNADVCYTYHKGSFEQDVILREQPPTPESLGLNSDTTEIQVLTEFIDPPDLVPVTAPRAPGSEPDISWGVMAIGPSRTYDLAEPETAGQLVTASRQYVTMDGRQILVEEVPLKYIQSSLSSLPQHAAVKSRHFMTASRHLSLPKTPLARAITAPMRVAPAPLDRHGYVLDYIEIVLAQTSYTFQADETYYINNEFGIGYGSATFEGGAVIKFNPVPTSSSIDLYGANYCDTAPYRPVIFTSEYDNSVGEVIASSTNPIATYFMPVGGPTALNFNWHDICVKYAHYGIYSYNAQMHDCQFVNCLYPLVMDTYSGGSLIATNILIVNAGSAFSGADFNATVFQLTVNHCTNLINDWYGATNDPVYLTNSLLVNVQNLGDGTIQSNYTAWVTDTGGTVLQTVGGGSSYLVTNSVYRNAGTTNMDPFVLQDIATKTTCPPIVFAATNFSTNQTFSPQAQRNTNAPDLGYHYAPLDYIFGGCVLSNTLAFTAGTAVGWYEATNSSVNVSGQPYGVCLQNGANLTSFGTATAPCWMTRYNLVQEDPNNWSGRGSMGGLVLNGSNTNNQPQINAQFTKWSTPPAMSNYWRDNWDFGLAACSDCEFYGGDLTSYGPSMCFTNCLFFRSDISFLEAASFTFQNSTFYDGGMVTTRTNASFWRVQDSAFDGTALQMNDSYGGSTNYTYLSYNAYNTNNFSWETYPPLNPNTNTFGALETVGPNDRYVNNYNWETSWFGDFYLPTNSPLIEKGSTTADQVGLYHFTTQTNQTVEGDSVVDIGYHYVATDANGNPLDTNGDGIPDYLEDANGDGIYDAGDLRDWQNPLYLNISICQPTAGSPLP